MRTFWLPEQAELCRPFVDRSFAALADIWKTRSNEIAQTFTELLFPSVLIEQEIVDRTDRYLAGRTPQPGLRRSLGESRDTVARALRARACDTTGTSDS